MAIADIRTGTIIDAEKGTFKYYHEQGHLTYNRLPIGIKRSYIQKNLIEFTILLLIVSIITIPFSPYYIISSITSLILMLIYFTLTFMEEMYCNEYAKNQLKFIELMKMKNDTKNKN